MIALTEEPAKSRLFTYFHGGKTLYKWYESEYDRATELSLRFALSQRTVAFLLTRSIFNSAYIRIFIGCFRSLSL
jgi:hypothetical protein